MLTNDGRELSRHTGVLTRRGQHRTTARRTARMTNIATNSEGWIRDVCQRFSNAAGWVLTFVPIDFADAASIKAELDQDPGCCWHVEVHDGQQTLGFLRLELPDGSDAGGGDQAMQEYANVVGELINTIAAARESLRSRTHEVSTLVDIGRSIPGKDDLFGALNQLLRAAVELTGMRTAGFLLLNPSTERLRLRASAHLDSEHFPQACRDLTQGAPDLDAIAGRQTSGFRRPRSVSTLESEETSPAAREPDRPSRGRVLLMRGQQPGAAAWLPADAAIGVCVPVRSDAGPLGTLWAFDRRRRTPSDGEWEILEAISAQIASVLERAVLLKESAVQQRIRRDLEAASRSAPRDVETRLAHDSPFDAAAQCTSRYELGGDLCEFIRVDNHRTLVALGDASGDSIPAAIVASAVRGGLASLAAGRRVHFERTDRMMQQINRALYGITPPHQFMSLILALIDSRRLRLTYTNAGHPAPFLAAGERARLLESHGMLLGVLSDATYQRSAVVLKPGDVFVAFSDGVSEAMNTNRRMFRADGIMAAVMKRRNESADCILQHVWSELESHSRGGSAADDRTLLVIKVRD